MFRFKKRHQEILARLDDLAARQTETEYWITEALRPLASKVDVDEAASETHSRVESLTKAIDTHATNTEGLRHEFENVRAAVNHVRHAVSLIHEYVVPVPTRVVPQRKN
jgi:hypothetical protein